MPVSFWVYITVTTLHFAAADIASIGVLSEQHKQSSGGCLTMKNTSVTLLFLHFFFTFKLRQTTLFMSYDNYNDWSMYIELPSM